MTAKEYNKDFEPRIHRAEEFVNFFESSIDHTSGLEPTVKEELLRQLKIHCWSEETRQTILTALEYYRYHEGLCKVDLLQQPSENQRP